MRLWKTLTLIILLTLVGLTAAPSSSIKAAPGTRVAEALELGPTFSGCPLGAYLLTRGKRQYVVYYDAERRVTVAQRTLGSGEWKQRKLPCRGSWDSHLGFALAIDSNGLLHLSGNMHCDPLVYFRSTEPYDIETLKEINRMVGEKENSVTYEQFLKGPKDRLIFWYRHGSSGNGQRIFNVWDPDEKTWSRLFRKPLFDGLDQMNAYPLGPKRGPDGNFHIVWMWRDTPDAATNHHISYVWTDDMEHWKTPAGRTIDLPITPKTEGVVVDPVPSREGLINMGFALGFDAQDRPIVSYHKYDENGKSQVYNARWEADHWQIYRTSDWDWRWEFGGGGSIPSRVGAGAVTPTGDGYLSQRYRNAREGSGVWKLDPETLKPVGKLKPRGFPIPRRVRKLRSDFPGMQVHISGDHGRSGEPDTRYYLRWESLPVNRDRPRKGNLPEPSTLMLYKLERGE